MNRYLVETRHEKKDCLQVMKNFIIHGHISNFDWGCENGTCAGWAIIEAESETEAKMSVPPFLRHTATVVKLNKFNPEKIQMFHEKLV